MKKLGIIGAMTMEVETLVSSMENAASKEIVGSTFYEGMLEGLPAVIVQCGRRGHLHPGRIPCQNQNRCQNRFYPWHIPTLWYSHQYSIILERKKQAKLT